MSKKKKKTKAEDVAYGLQIAIDCLQQENDPDALIAAELTMRRQLNVLDRLTQSFHELVLRIRKLKAIKNGDEWCFPALKIAKLLGVQSPQFSDYDEWFEDLLLDLGHTNKMIEYTYFGDESYLPESSVAFFIRFRSSFPDWVREKLQSWFSIYCAELTARDFFASSRRKNSLQTVQDEVAF